MKITNVKAMVAKMFTVGLIAAAVAVAAPARAEAQVGIGVRIGPAPYFGPVYRRPVIVEPAPAYGYYGPAFYGRRDWDRHEFYVRRDFRYRDPVKADAAQEQMPRQAGSRNGSPPFLPFRAGFLRVSSAGSASLVHLLSGKLALHKDLPLRSPGICSTARLRDRWSRHPR